MHTSFGAGFARSSLVPIDGLVAQKFLRAVASAKSGGAAQAAVLKTSGAKFGHMSLGGTVNVVEPAPHAR
jgi:hypothetical protein